MSSFDDLLAAGRIDEKQICIRGVELTVRPLTYAQAIDVAKLQKKAEAGDDSAHIELTKKSLKYAISKPAMDDAQIAKLMDTNSAFVAELLKAILAEIQPGDAEKN